MKRSIVIALTIALLGACSTKEIDIQTPVQDDVVFFASFERPAEEGTRVYANEDLLLRWTANDCVSIFNKNTYNQQYKFLGETGDNSGEFNKVDNAEFVTGNPLSHVVSVYPYQPSIKITDNEVLSVTLPAEQYYAQNTFGLGANTMVSVSSDNLLQYKNVCGFLALKLYGEGISISAIKLQGNNNEAIAGQASITMPLDGVPAITMGGNSTKEITLKCAIPVVIGSSAEKSTEFWFALPPVTFKNGFTITVKRKDGTAFTKTTSNAITVSRNSLSKMSPFEVVMEGTQSNNVIYYTSSDGKIVNPNNSAGFGAKLISNNYIDGVGLMTFDSDVTSIGNSAFYKCNTLTSIKIPISVAKLGNSAFSECSSLTSITIPESATSIDTYVFYNCSSLTSITIPESVTSIGNYAFYGCIGLTEISLPENLTSIGSRAFYNCSGITRLIIPENVTSIGERAFYSCSNLARVDVKPYNPPSLGTAAFTNCMIKYIYVQPESLNAFKADAGWGYLSEFFVATGITYIYYTTSTGRIIEPTSSVCGTSYYCDFDLISNEYVNGIGVMTFEGVATCFLGGFDNSSILTSIILPDSITSTSGWLFDNCSNLTSITLPKNIESIESCTFKDCSRLESITIPESVTHIGWRAFQGCSGLTSISIPGRVNAIDQEAFIDCTNLKRIDVKPVTPPNGGERMFSNTGYCPIYIPAGSEDSYKNASYWKQYVLRMRVEGSNEPIAYSSSDYSHDGEVIQLQKATVGRGVNIIFMGDGFLDKDMEIGGKYEQKMNEAMEQFFAYEPYYSFRNRFNIYAVKVVSKNDIYGDEASERALTYEENNSFYYRTGRTDEYGAKVPNPFNQPMKICTVCNTDDRLGRSWCFWYGTSSCFVMDKIGPVLNHELGGHAFGLLLDEYVEFSESYTDNASLDEMYETSGRGANVDWRSDPGAVRWAHFLNDSRYQYEGLGVYEGGYRYAHGVYRPTQDSMMNHNETPFNAPSREQIYKFIMKYSEGDDWVYNYEEFVKADERGRMEAAEELGPWNSPRRSAKIQSREEFHCPPITIDKTVKEVGIDKDGNIILVK